MLHTTLGSFVAGVFEAQMLAAFASRETMAIQPTALVGRRLELLRLYASGQRPLDEVTSHYAKGLKSCASMEPELLAPLMRTVLRDRTHWKPLDDLATATGVHASAAKARSDGVSRETPNRDLQDLHLGFIHRDHLSQEGFKCLRKRAARGLTRRDTSSHCVQLRAASTCAACWGRQRCKCCAGAALRVAAGEVAAGRVRGGGGAAPNRASSTKKKRKKKRGESRAEGSAEDRPLCSRQALTNACRRNSSPGGCRRSCCRTCAWRRRGRRQTEQAQRRRKRKKRGWREKQSRIGGARLKRRSPAALLFSGWLQEKLLQDVCVAEAGAAPNQAQRRRSGKRRVREKPRRGAAKIRSVPISSPDDCDCVAHENLRRGRRAAGAF